MDASRPERGWLTLVGIALALLGIASHWLAPALHHHTHTAVELNTESERVQVRWDEPHAVGQCGHAGRALALHGAAPTSSPGHDSDHPPYRTPDHEDDCGVCRLIASARPLIRASAPIVPVIVRVPAPTAPVVVHIPCGRVWCQVGRPRAPPTYRALRA